MSHHQTQAEPLSNYTGFYAWYIIAGMAPRDAIHANTMRFAEEYRIVADEIFPAPADDPRRPGRNRVDGLGANAPRPTDEQYAEFVRWTDNISAKLGVPLAHPHPSNLAAPLGQAWGIVGHRAAVAERDGAGGYSATYDRERASIEPVVLAAARELSRLLARLPNSRPAIEA